MVRWPDAKFEVTREEKKREGGHIRRLQSLGADAMQEAAEDKSSVTPSSSTRPGRRKDENINGNERSVRERGDLRGDNSETERPSGSEGQ